MDTITVIVEGGCVVDVRNLPPGWLYEIEDRDVTPDEEEAEHENHSSR